MVNLKALLGAFIRGSRVTNNQRVDIHRETAVDNNLVDWDDENDWILVNIDFDWILVEDPIWSIIWIHEDKKIAEENWIGIEILKFSCGLCNTEGLTFTTWIPLGSLVFQYGGLLHYFQSRLEFS